MFKRDVKKYNNFNDYKNKLEILNKVEIFLNNCEIDSNFVIDEDAARITIRNDYDLNHENYTEDSQDNDQIIIEYDPNEDEEISEVAIESVIKAKKNNTNDDLSDDQLQWIHEEIRKSEIAKGKKVFFRCSICGRTLSTSASLMRHLRDIHLLVDIEKKDDNIKAEVQRSKVNMLTTNGPEAQWKCFRCNNEDKLFKSEQSFKMHLRGAHINELQCENERVTKHKRLWLCPMSMCQERVFSSIEEVGTHVTKCHPDDHNFVSIIKQHLNSCTESENEERTSSLMKRKLNTLQDLSKSQINWIRNQLNESEFMSEKKLLHKCSLCGKELSTQASLVRHLRDLHLLKSIDEEKTVLNDELSASKVEVTSEEGNSVWKCLSCDRLYKSEAAFKLHYRITHNSRQVISSKLIASCKSSIIENEEVREVWKCPDCKRYFKRRDGLRIHIKIAHGNEIIEDGIEKLVKKKRLEHYVQNMSQDESNCNECGLKFLTGKNHMKPKIHREAHETLKILAPHLVHYKCELCRIMFSSETALQLHLKDHNNLENNDHIPIAVNGLGMYGAVSYKEPAGDANDVVCLEEALYDAWKCGHCSSKYIDVNDCISHQILLHSSIVFCCVDNRPFSGATGLSKFIQHMKNKHLEFFPNLKYSCSLCNREYSTIYEKLSHQKVCDEKKFICDYCGKKETTRHHLQAHILFELGMTGHSCEECGKRCKTMSDLKIHYNSHTNSRPYKCS